MHRGIVFFALVVSIGALAGCGGSNEESAPPPTVVPGQVPFDRAFIDAMVPHHRSAIEMARTAKEAGLAQPDLIEIADAIIETQQEEIDDMLRWREEWFGGEPHG